MSRRPGWEAAAVLLVAASLLAGCGSTVQPTGGLPVAQGGDGLVVTDPGGSDGLGVPGTAADGVPGGPSTASGGDPAVAGGATGGTVQASGGAAPTSGTASGAGTAGSPPRGAGPASGKGFTDKTVLIGVGTADDYNAFASSFGIKGVGYSGDPDAWFKAVVDDVNRRGGLAGRKIVLVKHDYNTAQLLNDPAAAHQAACATWVEDTPVFAVLLAGLLVDDNLLGCLGKAGTPLVQVGAGLDYPLHYQQSYEKFPLYFNLAQMVGDTYDRISIGRLVARKFFSPWDTRAGRPAAASTPTKVGLIGFEDPEGQTQLASWKRELAAKGLKSVSTIECPRPLSRKIQCQQSAVLRFASDGVTHVFGADSVFMNNASTQNYRPRYFVAVAARAFAANVSASQLNGAMGQGYIPYSDVDTADYPGDPTPATAYCKKLMSAAGQASTDPTTLSLQMSTCDEFFFVKAAIDAVGSLGATSLRTGLESLGSRQQSALTWKSFLGPKNHTSAAALRDLEYRSDTGRFVYVSTTNHS